MSASSDDAAVSGPERLRLRIRPTHGWASLQLKAIWEYRELLYFLVWRDLKVRYKQTALGVLWVVLQPLLSIAIFAVLFGRLLKVPTGGAPYPVFVLAGLLPWIYFSGALTRASGSLVGNAHLITKVYFPRLLIPLSAVISGLADLVVAFSVLLGAALFYRIVPSVGILLLPLFVLTALLTALGCGLWLSALNVRTEMLARLSPSSSRSGCTSHRWPTERTSSPPGSGFFSASTPWPESSRVFAGPFSGRSSRRDRTRCPIIALSSAITLVTLAGGLVFFRRIERTFADIV